MHFNFVDGDMFNLTGSNENGLNEESLLNSRPVSKSPAAFLGENSNLVNLDNLVSTNKTNGGAPLGGKWNFFIKDFESINNN